MRLYPDDIDGLTQNVFKMWFIRMDPSCDVEMSVSPIKSNDTIMQLNGSVTIGAVGAIGTDKFQTSQKITNIDLISLLECAV